MKKENEIHPSAKRKVINKSGLQQVTDQIKTFISEKCHDRRIVLDYSEKPLLNCKSLTLHAHTKGKWVKCPCCGKRSKTVHRYAYRKLQCTELLNHHVVLSLRVRHMKCRNPECENNIFAEPLSFARPYARHTDKVEEQIRHEALGQTAGKAVRTLSLHNIRTSPSSVTRRLRKMGKKNVVEPIKAMLGQKRERQAYPYPSEDEAYRYIMNDIFEFGEARQRNRIKFYYEVRRLKDEGNSIAETAEILGVRAQKVHRALNTDISRLLNAEQKCAVKAARDMARVVSSGAVTKGTVMKRMKASVSSHTLCRCQKSVTAHYKPLRDEVRRHNRALEERGKIPKVKVDTIWHYIVHGDTDSKRLQKIHETHPEVDRIMKICMDFRKLKCFILTGSEKKLPPKLTKNLF